MIKSLLLYLIGFIVCVGLLFILPPPYSTIALLALIALSTLWGVYRLRAVNAEPVESVAEADAAAENVTSANAISTNAISVDANSAVLQPVIARPMVAQSSVIAAIAALIGFGLMIAAALDLRPRTEQAYLPDGSLKLILGGVVVGIAVFMSKRLPPLSEPIFHALSRLERRWWVFAGTGTISMVVLAEINAQVLQFAPLMAVSINLQFLLLLAGCLLVGYGFGGAPAIRAGLRAAWREISSERGTVIILGGILVLAAFLRLWNQENTLRYLIDELHWSDGILRIEGTSTLRLLTPMSGQSPYTWLFPYWQSGAVAILGHTWTGFRFVSAITGTLTVFAVYGLAQALFDRKTALLAALIMATFPPHIHFSRVAMNLIADPLFGTMALMFVARALKNNNRIEWAFAGVSLGLTQYFYEGGRLLFPPLVIGFVVLLGLRGQMRGKWRGFFTLLVCAFLIGAPIYYTLIGDGQPLFGRFNDSGLGSSYWSQLSADGISVQDVLDQVQHTLTAFMMFGAHWDLSVYYGGQQALVNDALLPFFFFGCFYLTWRFPSPAFLIPLWIVATGLGNGLLRDTLVSARYYVVLPALALALTAGIRYLLPFWWLPSSTSLLPDGLSDGQPDAEAVKRREPRLRWAIPVLIAVIIAGYQVWYYYGPHLDFFNVQVRNSKGYRDGIDVTQRALALPGNTQIYIVGTPDHDQNVPRDWLNFLNRDGDPSRYFPLLSVTTDTISPKYLLDLPHGVNYAFFVAANEENTMRLIRNTFPEASPAQFSSDPYIPANKEYILFFVPSSAVTDERIDKS